MFVGKVLNIREDGFEERSHATEKRKGNANLAVGVLAEVPVGRRFVEEDDELLAFGGGEAARIVEGKGKKHLGGREGGQRRTTPRRWEDEEACDEEAFEACEGLGVGLD